VLDQERVERKPEPLGKDATERLLGLFGGPGPHHPESIGETVDVGVDRNPREAVAEHQHAVRRLRPDPRQRRELGERPRNDPAEPVEDLAGALPDEPGLGTIEADRMDQRLDHPRRRRGQRGGVRILREQARGRHVGLLVARALGEDRPDQHLERVLRVVAEVRGPPVARPVELAQPIEEPLPVVRPGKGRVHRPVLRGDAAGAVSVPGSERSGSSAVSFERTSSPIR
jgi:hypothetical protein